MKRSKFSVNSKIYHNQQELYLPATIAETIKDLASKAEDENSCVSGTISLTGTADEQQKIDNPCRRKVIYYYTSLKKNNPSSKEGYVSVHQASPEVDPERKNVGSSKLNV